MTEDGVKELLRAQPFRLICRDDRRFDITHPNYVRVWGGDVLIFLGDDPLGPMDRVEYLVPEAFERAELLTAVSPS